MTPEFDLSHLDPLDLVTLAAAVVDTRDDDRASKLVRFACMAMAESRPLSSEHPLSAGVMALGRARLAAVPKGGLGAALNLATRACNQIYLEVWGAPDDAPTGAPTPSSPDAVE